MGKSGRRRLRAGLQGEAGFLWAEMQDWGLGEILLKEETPRAETAGVQMMGSSASCCCRASAERGFLCCGPPGSDRSENSDCAELHFCMHAPSAERGPTVLFQFSGRV